ncbi:DTW domain protein [Bacteriovorax sp. BSW11_IV]|uniref:tRNA-uridine aminocarboxypropyltransferase n=1 Tax=Bacteriovorax sp. BSW11_IV TaxID=1353529 RepID=UPI00038A2E97|nr:tRNA-uridine aminocarboxypropyltransferase [Bacteriovorax sp. BSW11_IV]EQC45014.1 DTW domain protein [Bacteriovorax sp. BSW11_IV]
MEKKKRELCPKCDRPLPTCLCESIRAIPNKLHFLILRHKSESKHALGTVKICELSLSNITVLDGENFDHCEILDHFCSQNAYLVFPTERSEEISSITKINPESMYFIILDGTWNKAKKIFFETKKLHSLNAIKLTPEHASNYRIRKSNVKGGISTLECVNVLGENFDDVSYSPLLSAFEFMINKQIELMGEEVFKKNYC